MTVATRGGGSTAQRNGMKITGFYQSDGNGGLAGVEKKASHGLAGATRTLGRPPEKAKDPARARSPQKCSKMRLRI